MRQQGYLQEMLHLLSHDRGLSEPAHQRRLVEHHAHPAGIAPVQDAFLPVESGLHPAADTAVRDARDAAGGQDDLSRVVLGLQEAGHSLGFPVALIGGLRLQPEESCVLLRQGVFVIFPPPPLLRITQQANELVKFVTVNAVELGHGLDVVGAGHGLGRFDAADFAGRPAKIPGRPGSGELAPLAEEAELLPQTESPYCWTALLRWHRPRSFSGMEV